MRCPYPHPLQLLRRSKCGLLAPDWWSLNTHSTPDFKSRCPNMPIPIFGKQFPRPHLALTLIRALPPRKNLNVCKTRGAR